MTELTAPAEGPRSSRRSEEGSGYEAELQASLAALAGLVMGSQSLNDVLASVATYAAHAIPGADGAGVTLLRIEHPSHRVAALAASDPFVAEIDEIQYVALNEGPCITAALEGRTVRSGSLGGEKMWPRFGPRVGRLGVHSSLSLPLLLPGQVVGAINVYARGKDAFDDHATHLGEQFASPAAVAVHNAHVLAKARELTLQLQTALSTRPVIDQAIGLLRGRTGGSAERRSYCYANSAKGSTRSWSSWRNNWSMKPFAKPAPDTADPDPEVAAPIVSTDLAVRAEQGRPGVRSATRGGP